MVLFVCGYLGTHWDTGYHHLIDALKHVCLWKCLVSACAMFFVSVPSAPPSCSHLSWEGCKCPKRPQRISRHDRWRGSVTQGMGLAYLCHQCWAWRSHKQRWKNKNRYKMKRIKVLGWRSMWDGLGRDGCASLTRMSMSAAVVQAHPS